MLNNTQNKIISSPTTSSYNSGYSTLYWTIFSELNNNYSSIDIDYFTEDLIENNHKVFNKCKKENNYALYSSIFKNKIINSNEIMFIDKYFDNYMLNSLIKIIKSECLDNNFKSIKILTEYDIKGDRTKIIDLKSIEILENTLQKLKNKSIDISFTNLNYLHDRFAIFDNDLLLFGAAVGNMYPSLSSLSLHRIPNNFKEYFINRFQKATILKDYLNGIRPTTN